MILLMLYELLLTVADLLLNGEALLVDVCVRRVEAVVLYLRQFLLQKIYFL